MSTEEERRKSRERMRKLRDKPVGDLVCACGCPRILPDPRRVDSSGKRISKSNRMYATPACKLRAWRRRQES